MKKLTSFAVAGAAGAALAVAALQPAGAAPVADDGATTGSANAAAHRPDNRPGPQTKQWIAKRKAALEKVARGEARIDANGNVTVDAETNNVVEVAFERTDKIFTVLSEFGTQSAGTLRDRSWSSAQRDRPARTARWTTPPSGRPTSTPLTTKTCSTARVSR